VTSDPCQEGGGYGREGVTQGDAGRWPLVENGGWGAFLGLANFDQLPTEITIAKRESFGPVLLVNAGEDADGGT